MCHNTMVQANNNRWYWRKFMAGITKLSVILISYNKS